MTPQNCRSPAAAGLLERYDVDVDGADSLGADGAEALLAVCELDALLFAAFRPWKPKALPLG